MNDTITTTETQTVNVTIPFRVELERIEWSHLKTEDFHVRISEGRQDSIGIVGQDVIDTELWRVHLSAWLASTEEQDRMYARTFASRPAAVAALVRHARRAGVIRITI